MAAIPAQSQEGGRGPCQRGDKGGKGEGKVRQGEMEEEGGLVTSKWGGGKGKERHLFSSSFSSSEQLRGRDVCSILLLSSLVPLSVL